jgi:NAD(P)-dependent dehydrogenase (short-subunit alcohol dehydrogenase family)
MSDLRGKRFLVVGGETPLGRALAVGLADRGADVAIASLSRGTQAEFAINSALNELWALGRRGLALAIDASDPAQLRDAVARAERKLGRLDAAVVVEAASVAKEALERLRVIEVAADADAGEALRFVEEQVAEAGRS